jgi:spore coat protein U-like protein
MFTKKMSARLLTVAGATALVLGGITGTQAATDTANLTVEATVDANCTISTTAVDFGSYDPITANASADLTAPAGGKVTLLCTNGASATVTLGQGANAGGGSTAADPARRLRDGATSNYLNYTLFSDAGLATEWGDTAPTGVAHTGTGASADLDVYGVVPGGQNVPVGTYTDTVLATVTF